MKKNEVKVGGHYRAKVSGVLTTVRVDEVTDDTYPGRAGSGVRYHVTNLRTGRTTTFRSAAKFRGPADLKRDAGQAVAASGPHTPETEADVRAEYEPAEGEQRRPFGATGADCRTTGASAPTPCSGPATPAIPATDEPADPLGLKGDQRPAFDLLTARIAAGERVSKLCGYAGTGKTYLLARLAGWALARNYEVTVAAPTHKAAGVIADKLEGAGVAGVEVRTIHSLLGLTLAPDLENDTGGRVLVSPEAGKQKAKSGLVICDEASMVGAVLKEHIDRTPHAVRWLFVGDLAQLPPVGEGVSELLDEPDATLERVLRQAEGSEILNLATSIRGGDLSMACADGRDVYRVGTAEELLEAAHARFDTDDYRADPSHARLLVFRNARRETYNKTMRDLLVGSPDPYTAGEWLVMYAAFTPEKSQLNLMAERAKSFTKGTPGYGRAWREFFRRKESLPDQLPQLHTSEEVRIVGVDEGTVQVGGQDYNVYRLAVQDHDGGEHDLPVLTPEADAKRKENMAALVEAAQEFRAKMLEVPERSAAWQELDGKRRALWGAYYTLEETFAQVDYAYAMTVHKSQGSTFGHAFVDVPDLLSSGGVQQRILYTAVTRPAKSLTFYN